MKKFVKVMVLAVAIGAGSLGVSYTQGHSKTVYAETTATATTTSTETTTDEVDLSPQAREYSADELSDSYTSAETIALKDNGSSTTSSNVDISGNTITISAPGTYVISGTLTDGQIVVDCSDKEKVQLVLNGANITNTTQSPIFIKKAKDYAMITLASGTTNTLTDAETYTLPSDQTEELDATIYSKDDLVINGTGSLVINANYNDGIKSNDTLHIVSGNITVNSLHDAMYGKDSITIDGGNFNIVTNEGSAGKVMTFEQMGGGKGGFGANMGGRMTFPTEGQMPEGMTPPTDGQMPGGMSFSNNGQMAGGMTLPTDNQMQAGDQMGGKGMKGQGGMGGQMGQMDAQTSASMTNMNGQAPSGMVAPTGTQNTTATTTSTIETTEDEGSYKGIKSKGEIVINGGVFVIDTYDDAIKAGTFLEINDGTFDIKSGDDAIKGDYMLTINGGTINVTYCYEGIESEKVYLYGGDINIISKDDGINAALEDSTETTMGNPNGSNSAATDADPIIVIDGANIKVNADGDCVDSNGGITMNSGSLEVHGVNNGGELAVDADKQILINGGDLIVLGGSSTISSLSVQNVITTSLTESATVGSTLTIKNSSGTVLFSTVVERNTTAVTFSSSAIVQGQTYTISDGTNTTTVTASTTGTITGSFQGMNGGGMGGGRGQRADATTTK